MASPVSVVLVGGLGQTEVWRNVESAAGFWFLRDKTALQEQCRPSPDGGQSPWHNSDALRAGSARAGLHAGRSAPSRAGRRTFRSLAAAPAHSASAFKHAPRAGVYARSFAAVSLSASCAEDSGGLSCGAGPVRGVPAKPETDPGIGSKSPSVTPHRSAHLRL